MFTSVTYEIGEHFPACFVKKKLTQFQTKEVIKQIRSHKPTFISMLSNSDDNTEVKMYQNITEIMMRNNFHCEQTKTFFQGHTLLAVPQNRRYPHFYYNML